MTQKGIKAIDGEKITTGPNGAKKLLNIPVTLLGIMLVTVQDAPGGGFSARGTAGTARSPRRDDVRPDSDHSWSKEDHQTSNKLSEVHVFKGIPSLVAVWLCFCEGSASRAH